MQKIANVYKESEQRSPSNSSILYDPTAGKNIWQMRNTLSILSDEIEIREI